MAVYGTSASGTTTTLFGSGDRRLDALAFTGSSTVMTSADFVRFSGGNLTSNMGSGNWNDLIARDMNTSGNDCWGNPDRADLSTPFTNEASSKGTLSEVFGSPLGYKNLSWIVDGEDFGSYTLDLHFNSSFTLVPDNSAGSVELAVLERGGNSDFGVAGITGFNLDGSPILTPSLLITRSQTASAGWSLDTLEIGGAQAVHGVGISLPSEWGALLGVRVTALTSYNGPDIVAVGAIPTPGAVSLAGLAGVMAISRRRRN